MLGQVLRSLFAPGGGAARIESAPAEKAMQLKSAADVSGDDAALPAFAKALSARISRDLQQRSEARFDVERWGAAESENYRAIASGLSRQCLEVLLRSPAHFARAWSALADDTSREWLLALLAYRLLGHHHVELPIDTKHHWEQRALAASMPSEFSPVSGPFGPMRRYAVSFRSEKIDLEAYAGNLAWTFLLEQYWFDRNGMSIAPQPGDVVIDAGACFGDTALAFAAGVGEHGQVHAVEFDPGNLLIAERNLAANPHLAGRIRLHELALGAEPSRMYAYGSGPGAKVSSQPGGRPVEVNCIDGLASEWRRVDFIKMDIEGAEFDALRGAEQTLRRCRPALAISVYHDVVDLARVANWIRGLGLGYRLYLEHYTVHHEESVLFATTAGGAGGVA